MVFVRSERVRVSHYYLENSLGNSSGFYRNILRCYSRLLFIPIFGNCVPRKTDEDLQTTYIGTNAKKIFKNDQKGFENKRRTRLLNYDL